MTQVFIYIRLPFFCCLEKVILSFSFILSRNFYSQSFYKSISNRYIDSENIVYRKEGIIGDYDSEIISEKREVNNLDDNSINKYAPEKHFVDCIKGYPKKLYPAK